MSAAKGSFCKASAAAKPKKQYPRITLRLSEEEHARLTHLAAGMSLSAYIRNCIFGKGASPRKIRARAPLKDDVALARVLGLLGQSNIANSLRELAYAAKFGALPVDDKTTAEIHAATQYVMQMRGALMKALGVIENPGA